LVLSGEERRVINMHRNLERYLDLPEAERIGGTTSAVRREVIGAEPTK